MFYLTGRECGGLCDVNAFAVDCELSDWGRWSGCSRPRSRVSGSGPCQQNRKKSVIKERARLGESCSYDRDESRPCAAGGCASGTSTLLLLHYCFYILLISVNSLNQQAIFNYHYLLLFYYVSHLKT